MIEQFESKIEKLFFSIWRNNYLKNEILKSLRILKQNEFILFFRLEDLRNYKYRDYLCGIVIATNKEIQKNDIPDNGVLKSIVLYQGCVPFNNSFIPNTVKELHFDAVYSNSICFKNLPQSVDTINNYYFQKKYKPKVLVTPSIKTLIFTKYQGKITNETIPNTVETLIFEKNWKNDGFDLQIGDFKYGLKRLNIFGYNNKFIANILPDSLTHLILTINHTFNSKDENKYFLPKFLKTLQINSNLIGIKKGMLSNTIENLTLTIFNENPIEKQSIPSSVKNLNLTILGITSKLLISNEILPKSLQKLVIKNYGFINFEIDSFKFTNYLTELNLIDSKFNDDLIKHFLPPSLLILKLSNCFNRPINFNSFPNNLIQLEFGCLFNHPILPSVLPSSLTFLKLSDHFNQKLYANGFPINLKSLIFGQLNSNFNQIIQPNILPQSITYLDFYCPNYKHIIDTPNILPSSLITLVRSNSIKHLITDNALPKTLKFIKC
ncbi:hypothetical protein ACTFIZ_003435 [Dictyostelium cf. discoideum]